jgi:phenylalanyl-tRNA synthetase beta chain
MRAPLSWLREYVDLPDDLSTTELTHRLTALGLKLEGLEAPGAEIEGPLVVGRILGFDEEPQKNGKVIRWCRVDVGPVHNRVHDDAEGGSGEYRGIVCGARNFAVDDLVVVSLPGSVLPGPFPISARKTYGHVSDGMICSTKELGTGDDHGGILVLDPRIDGDAKPGDDAVELLHLRDEVIEFEINPDRAYGLSLRGIAREAALGLDVPFRDPASREVPAPNDAGYPVRVEAEDGCPVFVTRTVTGFDPTAPTPRWLARRIQLAGMRPISLAVDVTNYVMLELGQPIHGYDGDRLSGPIAVRRADPGERLTTLDGAIRDLDPDDLLITDDRGPIGLAGVMGGQETELADDTTHVVIEAAHFDPVSIFRTARRHKLPSEASKRFDRGVDPLLPAYAADRVAELLAAHGGGTVTEGVTYVGRAPEARTITIDASLPARVTGIPIDADTAEAYLRAVGCTVTVDGSVDGTTLTAMPPSWRPDLNDPYDLVEEVARIVGYDQVPSVLPTAPAGRGLTREQRLRRRAGLALAGAGYVEVLTYPFVGTADWDALGLDAGDRRRETVRVANPLSEEEPELRTTLLPGLLKALARNVGRGISDVALFEQAPVYLPTPGAGAAPILGVGRRPTAGEWEALQAAIPDQPMHTALVFAGDREPAGWWGRGRPASWADAVESVRRLARGLGAEVDVRAGAHAPWHPGRCAEVVLDGAVVGYAGELHPSVCTAFGVPARTAVAEVDLDALVRGARSIVPAPVFSTYPVAKEDVALVVSAGVAAADVAATLREGAGPLLESVRLFDVYTGEQIGEGKKSLAYAMRFRAPDRTLTDAEVAEARDAAVALAVQRHGAVHRG